MSNARHTTPKGTLPARRPLSAGLKRDARYTRRTATTLPTLEDRRVRKLLTTSDEVPDNCSPRRSPSRIVPFRLRRLAHHSTSVQVGGNVVPSLLQLLTQRGRARRRSRSAPFARGEGRAVAPRLDYLPRR